MLGLVAFAALAQLAAGVLRMQSSVFTLTAPSGLVSSSTTSFNDQFEWKLTPSISATKYQFVVEALNAGQMELRIYDNSAVTSGTFIWNCASCGTTLPPPFFSKTNSTTIFVKAVTGVGFRQSSFRIFYIAIPAISTDSIRNTTINMNMGYGSIAPYQSAAKNPPGADQRWLIRPPVNTLITLAFSFIELADADRVRIYDGNSTTSILIFDSSNSSQIRESSYWWYAVTGCALVQFTTAPQPTTSTFLLTYQTDSTLYKCGSFLYPNVLTGDSLMITDGTASASLMRRGESCSWLLTPRPPASALTLTFKWVSLKFGGTVVVYDGRNSSGVVLWSGNGATTTVPPPLTSSSPFLYMEYASDSTDPVIYKGFFGEYESHHSSSVGSGAGFVTLSMSQALDVRPPGDRSQYSRGVSYSWLVRPTNTIGPITFAFAKLNLVDSGDVLQVFDGSAVNVSALIATFRGPCTLTPDYWLTTTKTTATVTFSASSVPLEGGVFQLAYFADGRNYHCGFPTNPAVLSMASFTISDGSASTESVYSSQNCRWSLSPPADRNTSGVVIAFRRFSLRGGSLSIASDGRVYTTISESSAVPGPVFLPGKTFALQYLTGSNPTGYGFSLTYYYVQHPASFPGDGIVRYSSPSAFSLTSARPSSGIIGARSNLTWVVSPSGSVGRIYFAVVKTSLAEDCSTQLLLYDGADTSSISLASLCGGALSIPYKWIVTSGPAAVLQLQSTLPGTARADFELSYYSDGPAYHCGFLNNPATVNAPSMMITDGSLRSDPLYSNQLCEWVIAPNVAQSTPSPVIVLEFLDLDVRGAQLVVSGVWNCTGCAWKPGPLVLKLPQAFVEYNSGQSGLGKGFTAVYWTITNASDTLRHSRSDHSKVLEVPEGVLMSAGPGSADDDDPRNSHYHLPALGSLSSLMYSSEYSAEVVAVLGATDVFDGRPADMVGVETSQDPLQTCGVLLNPVVTPIPKLKAAGLEYYPTQSADFFLQSSVSRKTVYRIEGDSYSDILGTSLLTSKSVCQYRLASGSYQAIVIVLREFSASHGRLLIYGGLLGNDSLLFNSSATAAGGPQVGQNITAPCGRATIVLDTGDIAPALALASMQIDFVAMASDHGEQCAAYWESLQPPKEKSSPLLAIYVSLAGFFGLLLIASAVYFVNKMIARRGYLFYPGDPCTRSPFSMASPPRRVKSRYSKMTPNYPRYLGSWDQWRNHLFLRPGTCCVCKTHASRVFRLRCGHAVCMEDSKGYLESALGDISMFPVKCPMHYEACAGTLDAGIAKRILSEAQYARFIEFSDRAIYGDGMRCIFCQNYVNFPSDMTHMARVECPYCVQCFCVRCKKPWHYGSKCPLEVVDESLEDWKRRSGAQKCPACKKLIEKDDPDTCNHMVHKITDPIPCIRDRTDFCYLCGEEVTPNYPHEEVAHLGVNHFPEGVFQKCRTIIVQEKQAEIDRLKRVKRLKNQNPAVMSSPSRRQNAQVVPTNDWEPMSFSERGVSTQLVLAQPAPEAAWLNEPQRNGGSNRGANAAVYDQFDQEWEMAIAVARSSAAPSPVVLEITSPMTSPSPSARNRPPLQGARGSSIAPPPGSPALNPLHAETIASPSPSQRLRGGGGSSRTPIGSPQQQRRQFPRFEAADR